MQAVVGDRRWLKRFGRRDARADVALLCFHHAGGSAAMYRQWPQLLPPAIESIAVQLPGRADRFNEAPHDRMAALVADLVEVIRPLLDGPFAFHGVSMGSRVAWALTHALRGRGMPMPRLLSVACDPAPVHGTGSDRWENREDGLEGYVREMGGTPSEVLADPRFLAALLPALGADLTVLSTHDFRPAAPLDIPIVAFAGIDDPDATPERMEGWRGETTARFELHTVACGHFFDADGERRVARTLGQHLAR